MDRILAIELKRSGEAGSKAFKKLFPTTFLAVDTGDFLDPSDPPITILLGYRRVRIGHSQTPHKHGYYISLLLSTYPVSLPAKEDISESVLFAKRAQGCTGRVRSVRASVGYQLWRRSQGSYKVEAVAFLDSLTEPHGKGLLRGFHLLHELRRRLSLIKDDRHCALGALLSPAANP